MKSILSLLFVIFAAFACPAQDDHQAEGALSANLKLAIAHQPKGGNDLEHFQITLSNVSGKELDLVVFDKEYWGTIVIALKGEKPVESYEREYLRKLRIGILPSHFTTLAKDGTIVWKIPIADLRAGNDQSVKAEALHGAKVQAELHRLSIVPKRGKYGPSNARQTSPPITISKQ